AMDTPTLPTNVSSKSYSTVTFSVKQELTWDHGRAKRTFRSDSISRRPAKLARTKAKSKRCQATKSLMVTR
ncbi:MAG: hypothetical protein WBD31_00665, partial [Rubripirellula sp.]